MHITATRAGRRALASSALAGAVLAALTFGAHPASAAYTAKVQAGTLKISGDGASDKLALRLAPGAPTILQVDVGEDGTADFSFDRSTFTAIDVEAGGGDDDVRIDQSGGLFTDEAVTLNGGAGNDTLIGGDGADTLIGGAGNDFADGNRGNDTALLGAGDDTFQWDPGDGSDVVEGQGGDDLLDFNGSNANENVSVTANGSRVRFTRDVAAITMDLDGIEHVGFHALGGLDNVTVGDLTGTATKTVDVDLDATGGGGDGAADTVTALGTDGADGLKLSSSGTQEVIGGLAAQTRVTGGEPALDNIDVEGLGGDDTFTTTSATPGTVPVTFDGGAGSDMSQFNGTAGDDQIGIARNGAAVATFAPGSALLNTTATTESLVVSGLDGNDTLAGQNGLAGITALTLDGGDGDDTLLGGDGDDLLLGGKGNDHVDGNRGNDTALLGSGDDTFQWDPGDGSDTVEGQGGSDTLAFNGSNAGERIELAANGPRLRLTRDVGAITMDTDGIDAVDVATLGSADTVTVDDLDGTDVKTVDVDLDATGGGGDGAADTVIARGTDAADKVTFTSPDGRPVVNGLGAATRVTGGEPALDNLVVQTLGGADTATFNLGTTSPIPIHFDGGDDVDTARYNGTAGPDVIGLATTGTELAAFSTGSATFDTAPSVESLVVSGLGGDDTIAGQNGLATLTPLTIDGGDGNDTLLGGDGNDTLLGGKGNDLVDGNRGNDTALLGVGDDRFQWDPGDGNDVVEGQGGDDSLDFNGSNAGENISVSANGPRVRLTRDVAAILMDLDGIEHVNVRTFGSADTVTVNDLTGTDVDTVGLDLGANGGGGDGAADTVIVNGTAHRDAVQVTRSGSQVSVAGLRAVTQIVGSEPALDTLRVQTLAGNDDVTVAPDVSTLIQTIVDLGTDE